MGPAVGVVQSSLLLSVECFGQLDSGHNYASELIRPVEISSLSTIVDARPHETLSWHFLLHPLPAK